MPRPLEIKLQAKSVREIGSVPISDMTAPGGLSLTGGNSDVTITREFMKETGKSTATPMTVDAQKKR